MLNIYSPCQGEDKDPTTKNLLELTKHIVQERIFGANPNELRGAQQKENKAEAFRSTKWKDKPH